MKWIFGISCPLLVAFVVNPVQQFPSGYKRVDAYEIRPGLLATPKYSSEGNLCEVFIEKRHLQDDTVELQPTIPRKLALELVDELAPPSERGKPTMQIAGHDYLDSIQGRIVVAIAAYDKVTVQIVSSPSDTEDTAVVLRWKNVGCISKK